jgi:hypothetical protein
MKLSRPLIVVTVALVGAGCGAATPPSNTGQSSSNTGQSSPSNPGAAAYRYADCMRSHGVSGFPDPRIHISGNSVSVIQQLPASAAASPRFKSASHACRGIIPAPQNATQSGQAQRRQVFFAFARCMRAHGVSDFPDPTSQGQITPQMITAAGVDLHSHQVLDAGLSCVAVTHGAITRADIYQAVSGNH